MKRIGWSFACAAALVACGGSTSSLGSGQGGSSTVTGTAGGKPVATTEAVGDTGSEVVNGVTVSYAGVIITNLSGTCAILQRHGNPPNATALSVAVAAEGTAVPAGTYVVGAQTTQTATATFDSQDATCTETTGENASGGTVTITSVGSTAIEGSFDLTFPSGDHLTGDFSASVCAFDITGTTTPGACGS